MGYLFDVMWHGGDKPSSSRCHPTVWDRRLVSRFERDHELLNSGLSERLHCLLVDKLGDVLCFMQYRHSAAFAHRLCSGIDRWRRVCRAVSVYGLHKRRMPNRLLRIELDAMARMLQAV